MFHNLRALLTANGVGGSIPRNGMIVEHISFGGSKTIQIDKGATKKFWMLFL